MAKSKITESKGRIGEPQEYVEFSTKYHNFVDQESGAVEMAEALDNLIYLAKNESNGAGVWAKYIQQAENALTKYRIPYPSEAE